MNDLIRTYLYRYRIAITYNNPIRFLYVYIKSSKSLEIK